MIQGRHLYIFIGLLFLLSCSSPPPEAPFVPLFHSLEDFLSSNEKPSGISDLFFSFRTLAETDDLVSTLHRGDRLILRGKEASPQSNTLVYTRGVNSIATHRDLYVTSDRSRKLYYSLDLEHWYDMKNQRRKGLVNIDYQYPMESSFDVSTGVLQLDYQWIAGTSSDPTPVKMADKPLIILTEGHIFYSDVDDQNTLNLRRVFLKIPRGTKIDFSISFSGNLIQSRIDRGVHRMDIVNDFYIYTSNDSDLKMGISSDGLHWNFNPFDFHYLVEEQFSCSEIGQLQYSRNIEIIYDF